MTRNTAACAIAIALGSLTFGVAASAELAPEEYVTMRQASAHHIQLRINRVAGLPWYLDHGPCLVRGEVVRVFKGDHKVGDDLEFNVDCAKPRARLPNGAALWTSQRALDEASHIEAFLDASNAVAGWQTVLLEEASDEPACAEDSTAPC